MRCAEMGSNFLFFCRNIALLSTENEEEQKLMEWKLKQILSRADIRYQVVDINECPMSAVLFIPNNKYLCFRRYQTFVDQQEHLILLKMMLKKKMTGTESTRKTEFDQKLHMKRLLHLEELRRLEHEHNFRRKRLEEAISDSKLRKKFNEVINLREIIFIECKNCQELENVIFDKLNIL